MRNTVTLALALLAGLQLHANGPARAGAESIALSFDRGLVTIHASKVSAAEILKQYGAVGHVEILNLEVLPPTEISIALDNVPEGTALDILTRCCGGYLATRRVAAEFNTSSFRRIVIVRANSSTAGSLPPPDRQPPPVDVIEPPAEFIEPAPGEVRPRLGPDGKPIADDQQDAPPPPFEG